MQDVIPQLRRLFIWDHWANRATLDSLATMTLLTPKTLKRMAHIIATQDLWISRLNGEDTAGRPVWPDWSVEEIESHMGELAHDWLAFLNDVKPEHLKERVAYINSKGERWENAIGDMLLQVIMHGEHHRGQIAAEVREAGGEPAQADFIDAVRKGFVK